MAMMQSGRLREARTPHGAAVDPDGLAEAGAGGHLDLLLKQLLVIHRPLRNPEGLGLSGDAVSKGCAVAERDRIDETPTRGGTLPWEGGAQAREADHRTSRRLGRRTGRRLAKREAGMDG